jgi:magnesium transporter
MSELQTIPTSVSALMGMRVVDAAGKALGRVHEFAVDPAHDEAHVVALVLKHRAGGKTRNTLLPVAEISMPKAGQSGLRAKITPKPIKKLNDYLLLDYDLLDQQIIDVDGRKVVRVNDVNLRGGGGDARRGAAAAEGAAGGYGGAGAGRFRTSVIPWDFVDLIDRDPSRRVKLKIEQDRLAKMHPSDLADILEELAPAERQALFSSLDEEVAAEALEEVEPRMQKALTESLDSEQVAGHCGGDGPGGGGGLSGGAAGGAVGGDPGRDGSGGAAGCEELLEFSGNAARAR